MNNKLQYEQLITEKLEALPVPDIADAIWARIEAQLDLDMPTDDGSGGGEPAPDAPSGGSNLLGHIGVFVAIVALVTFFFISKKEKQNNLAPNTPLPTTKIVQTDSAPPPDETPPAQNTLPITAQSSPLVRPSSTGPDSALNYPVATTPVPDSAIASNVPAAPVNVPVVAPPAKDSLPSKRKKGVQLDDADYRIVPKRDSLP